MPMQKNESKFTPTLRKKFVTMADAFDYCREADRPVHVYVGKEEWRLWPSGKAQQLNKRREYDDAERIEAHIEGEAHDHP
jgi:hypothetical protein